MLVTFGSEQPKRTETHNTNLDIVLKDARVMKINAGVGSQIAESIQRQSMNLNSLDSWKCLWNGFLLTDNLPSKREISSIDLFIGND